jgi:hypothetical protein
MTATGSWEFPTLNFSQKNNNINLLVIGMDIYIDK